MTQYATYEPYRAMPQSNGLGLAGFICSLVGLVTGGLLSPIGLILSIAGLGREPRGFAIAGLIIGLIGSCGGLIVLFVFGAVILAALGIATVAALAFSEPQKFEITTDMVMVAAAVEKYRENNDYLPASLDLLSVSEQHMTDPWGMPYRYLQLDPKRNFDLVTAGEDKTFDTKDDVKLSEIEKMWSMSKGVKVSRREKDSVVRIDLGGDGDVNVDSSKEGQTVKVDIGGKTIEVKSDEPIAPAPPEAPEPPQTEQPEATDSPTSPE